MNHVEFKEAVRIMRQAQKHYFYLKADDPNKQAAKEAMRSKELPVWGEVERVMNLRNPGQTPKNDKEEFFLIVADLVKAHKIWIRTRYSTDRDFARQLEHKVDVWIKADDERIKEQREREYAKLQTSLFP